MKITKEIKERFWSKVDRSHGVDHCWIWLAAKGISYGNFYVGRNDQGKKIYKKPHIFAYLTLRGNIPHGKILRHSCDNDFCCNPKHLKPGTLKENQADVVKRGRRTAPRRQLNIIDVKGIKALLAVGFSIVRCAHLFGVSTTCIDSIKAGKTWRNVA